MADLKDLLLKLANQSRLTPHELADLGRYGTEIQVNNAYVAGLKNGSSVINASRISGIFDTPPFGVSVKVRNSNLSIPDSVGSPYTKIAYNQVVFDDQKFYDSSLSTTNVVAPVTGKYRVSIYAYWESGAGNVRATYIFKEPSSLLVSDFVRMTGTHAITQYVEDDVNLVKGDIITARAYQDSGGALDLTIIKLIVSLIRESDAET